MNKLTFKAKIIRKVFLIILFISCVFLPDKTFGQIRTSDAEKILNLIEGEWEWVSTSGGYLNTYFTPSSRGYTLKYDFERVENTADSIEFWFYKNDSMKHHAKVKFSYFNNMYGANYWYFDYLYGEMLGNNLIFSFYNSDTIYFSENAFDGFSHCYAKSNLSGINILNKKSGLLYPNPSSGIIHLNQVDHISQLEVVDLSGQVVKDFKKVEGNTLNLRFLKSGIYLIRIRSGNGEYFSEKLYLQKE